MQIAAEKGTTDTMRCLQNCNVSLTDDAFLPCLRGRKLDNLRYFVESGCTVPEDACVLATMLSNRACLEFLHQRGFALTLLCSINASSGRLPMLQYLHEQSCHWDARCCAAAALCNHVDCLQYLHKNGCPWEENSIAAAIARRSWDCLWYALRHGCPSMFLLQLGLSVFVAGGYMYSLLGSDFSGEWYKTRMIHIALFVMASSSLLTILNENFGAYYPEYITPQTATKFASRFSFVGFLFGVYYLVQAYHATSK